MKNEFFNKYFFVYLKKFLSFLKTIINMKNFENINIFFYNTSFKNIYYFERKNFYHFIIF